MDAHAQRIVATRLDRERDRLHRFGSPLRLSVSLPRYGVERPFRRFLRRRTPARWEEARSRSRRRQTSCGLVQIGRTGEPSPRNRSLDGDCAGISRRENFQEGGRSPSRRKQLRVAVRFVTAAPRTDSQNQPAALRNSLCSAACCVTGYRTPRFTVQFPSLHIDLIGLKRATSQNRRCNRSAQRKRLPRRPAAPPGDPVLPPGSSRTTGRSGVSMEWAPSGRAAHGRMSIRGATRLREQPELRSVTAGSVSLSL